MKEGKIEYSHTKKPDKPDGTEKPKQALDPNHSHFILVDNARIGFGGEIDFRANLESAISENAIPIVVLVLEGGAGTIKTVLESVKKKNTMCFY